MLAPAPAIDTQLVEVGAEEAEGNLTAEETNWIGRDHPMKLRIAGLEEGRWERRPAADGRSLESECGRGHVHDQAAGLFDRPRSLVAVGEEVCSSYGWGANP